MNGWWRAYEGAVFDPKVQSLPPPLFKLWFNLLCIASGNNGVIPPVDELKSVLSLRYDHLKMGLKTLLDRGLIDEIDGHLEPHNWRKRQYKYDKSAARTKRWRDGKCDAENLVTVTQPDYRLQKDRVFPTAAREAAPVEKKNPANNKNHFPAGSLASALPSGALARQPSAKRKAQAAWENDLRQKLGADVETYAEAINMLAAHPELVERATEAEIRKPGSGVMAAAIGLKHISETVPP